MKYNIYINQKSLAELSEKTGVKIDLIDWALISWIKDFHNEPKIKKIQIDWKQYFWLAYKHILNDMPLLWLKTKWAISDRLKKLCNLWLLEKYFDLEWWSLTYFYCTQEFYNLERVNVWTVGGSVRKLEGLGFKTGGGSVWKPYNHNTNNHNTINNTNNISKEIQSEIVWIDFWKKEISKKEKKSKTKKEEYWNEELNLMFDFLKKLFSRENFKETQQWQRRYLKHITGLIKKEWKDIIISKLKILQNDEFKFSNCWSLKYIYWELKSLPLWEIPKKWRIYSAKNL